MDKTQKPKAATVIIRAIAEGVGEKTTGYRNTATLTASTMIAKQARKIVCISWRSRLPDGIRPNNLMANSSCPSTLLLLPFDLPEQQTYS